MQMPTLLRGAFLPTAFLYAALFFSPGAALSCMDGSGASTDFWFGLKTGGCTNASSPLCSYFASYPRALSGAPLGTLPFASSLAGGATSALGATLSALAAARLANATLAVHWNDDPPARFLPLPSTAGSFNAHAKGVLAADSSGGVWLTHSWPHFPDVPAFAPAWGIGESSTTFGQSFLCVSLPLPQVERLAAALLRMEPRVYDAAAAPPALRSALPTLSALAAGARNASFPLPTLTDLTSAGGLRFLHVSKNGAWGGELYSGAVLPALGASSLWVETWRRSPALASICSASGSALNVAALNVTEGSGARPALQSYTTDHSKWAVSVCPALARVGVGWAADGSKGPSACPSDFRRWVCVGDINMMASQSARGGGTVCFDHAPDLWAALVSAVAGVDTCNISASSSALAASNSSSSSSSSGNSSGSSSGAVNTNSSAAGSGNSSGTVSNSSALAANSSSSSGNSSGGSVSSSSSGGSAGSGSSSGSSGSRAPSPSASVTTAMYTSSVTPSTSSSITRTATGSSSRTCSPSPSPPPPGQLAQQQQGRQASPEQALLGAAAPIGYACIAAAVLGAVALLLARARQQRAAKGRLTAASAAAGAPPPRHAQWRVRDLLA